MAAIDKTLGGVGEPAYHAVAVTPSDADDLEVISRALYIGGAGDVAVTMAGGDAVVFSGATAGSFLPIRVKRVRSTGTTATLVLSLY